MEVGIGDAEQRKREHESEQAREEHAVEKLNEAEQRRADKGLESGQTPGGESEELDRAAETWRRLAGTVSPENVPSE